MHGCVPHRPPRFFLAFGACCDGPISDEVGRRAATVSPDVVPGGRSRDDTVGVAVYLTQGGIRGRQAGHSLDGSFSAVSMSNFEINASIESSCRDSHNTHFPTELRYQMFN